MTTLPVASGSISSQVRLYHNRASYQFQAARAIFREVPVAHVAFVLPADEGKTRAETVMNVPLISVIMREGTRDDLEEDGQDEGDDWDEINDYAVYLHTHGHSGLVDAIKSGTNNLTASTTKIDGLIFSPTAHDHSLNYRSATLHLSSPIILSSNIPSEHEEKRRALSNVTNTVTGYSRTSQVGLPDDPNTARTTVIKCMISAVSCKQRMGGFDSFKEPVLNRPSGMEETAFRGVVPCWTQWGDTIGYGRDTLEVEQLAKAKNAEAKRFAESAAYAVEDAKIEGIGLRKKKGM